MAANYTTNLSELSLKKGCPRINALKESIGSNSSETTEFFPYSNVTTEEMMLAQSSFGRLFFAAKEKYKLRPEDIGIVLEGNMSVSAGKELTPQALACVNVFNPIVTSFFTSTVECRSFIRYWAHCKGYPMFEPLLGSAWIEESEQMWMEEFEQSRKQQRPMYDGFRPIGGEELLIARHPKPQIAILNKILSESGTNTKCQIEGMQIILEALRSYFHVPIEVKNDSQETDCFVSNTSGTEAGFFKPALVQQQEGDRYLVKVETPPRTAMNSDDTATSLKTTTLPPAKASTLVAAAHTMSDVPPATTGCLNLAQRLRPGLRIFGMTTVAPVAPTIPVNQSSDEANTARESFSHSRINGN